MNVEPVYTYELSNSLYINLCNRCTAFCVFCPIRTHPVVEGRDLSMTREQEPTAAQVIALVGDPRKYDEVVFCGFGEPTLRLQELKEIAAWVKSNGGRIRLNTNGHGNLIHGRDITPELRDLVDCVSISLNAADAQSYVKITRPSFGAPAFEAMLDFIRSAKVHIPRVVVSVVGIPNVDLVACRRLAESLNVELRRRPHTDLAVSTKGVCHSG